MTQQDALFLKAYHLRELEREPLPIVPAGQFRHWMDQIAHNNAYRCLPLMIANQSGWLVLNIFRYLVHWDGSDSTSGIKIVCPDGGKEPYNLLKSIFGYGIITWGIPYLFRTSPGYNLLARGPANVIKKGIQPLEGLVETDWNPAPFTMNWKITHPKELITFEAGEPICMIVPQKREELECFETTVCDSSELPERERTIEWIKSRHQVVQRRQEDETYREANPWEGTYFRGELSPGTKEEGRFEAHQTRRRLNSFSEEWNSIRQPGLRSK